MTLSECTTDKLKLIIGYTTREHLLVDLDNTTLHKAIGIAKLLIHSYPQVGNILLVLSSIQTEDLGTKISSKGKPVHFFPRACFHLVGDNNMSYNECCKIIMSLVHLNVLEHAFLKIRHMRNDMTLRVSPVVLSNRVREQPQPIIYIFNRHNNHRDYRILDYLNLWSCAGSLFSRYDHTKNSTYYRAYCTYYTCCEDTVNTIH